VKAFADSSVDVSGLLTSHGQRMHEHIYAECDKQGGIDTFLKAGNIVRNLNGGRGSLKAAVEEEKEEEGEEEEEESMFWATQKLEVFFM
jgi:hypothetical protein